MNLKRIKYFGLFLVLSVLFSGCAIGPDYVRPELNLNEKYIEPVVSGETIANMPWWDLFKDPVFQDLVRIALAENKDLKTAIARVDASRALLGVTRADQFPRIDGNARGQRRDPSDALIDFDIHPHNTFGLFADLSWELDIWGKLRRATAAQQAELLATEYAQRAVIVELVSQVATAYLKILGTEDRLAISRETLKSRQGSTSLIRARFEKGVIPELDVNQAQIEEVEAAVIATTAERQLRIAEHALAALLGRMPYVIPRGKSMESLARDIELPAGFPANLLERRPDILAAELQAKSAVEQIGVAKAEQLPSFNLLGFVGLESREISDLLERKAFTWGIGGDLLGPLLDWGKSASQVEFAEANAQALLHQYEQSVIVAVREVEDALVGIRTFREEREQRELQQKAASNAAKLSRARYDDGVTSYLEVLDIERSQFEADLSASSSLENYYAAIIQLYKALGGGWGYADEATTNSAPMLKP